MAAGGSNSADKIQGLLRWCQAQADGYPSVSVTNFTSSFRDGLAFCAILHRYRPDLIDFHALKASDPLANNRLAFRAAESIGIPALLDAEDMATPEKLSIITYVAYINMHMRGRKRRGGPTVNLFAGNNNSSGSVMQDSRRDAAAASSSIQAESTAGMAKGQAWRN